MCISVAHPNCIIMINVSHISHISQISQMSFVSHMSYLSRISSIGHINCTICISYMILELVIASIKGVHKYKYKF